MNSRKDYAIDFSGGEEDAELTATMLNGDRISIATSCCGNRGHFTCKTDEFLSIASQILTMIEDVQRSKEKVESAQSLINDLSGAK